MENAKRKIPFIISLLEKTFSKETKNLEEWNRLLVSSKDPLVIRQAKGNVSSNKDRTIQLEAALLELYPLEQREKDNKENKLSV